ncbi:hypothetical protein J6V86_02620 [bacterium]|nr:hypothetical protein [bacterium]
MVFGQGEILFGQEYPDLIEFQKKEYLDKDSIIELVENLNDDERCV